MKKIISYILGALLMGCLMFDSLSFALPSSFINEINGGVDAGGDVKTYSISSVSATNNLESNIMALFHPSTGGEIRNILRNVGVGILVIFLVRGGFMMIYNADNDGELKKAKMNFLYILYGAILFFCATWVMGTALSLDNLDNGSQGLINNLQGGLMLQVLTFFKAAAFFVAVMMIAYHGFNIVRAFDKDDKIKEARKGILNVVIALVFIKIIDYMYFLAQRSDFKTQAGDFIASFNRMLGYILGGFMILSIFYAGVMLVTSAGDDGRWKTAKAVIQTIFIVGLLVVIFLLIVQQVLMEFR